MTYSCDYSSFGSGFLTGFWSSFAEMYILTIIVMIFLYGLIAYCLKSFGLYKMAQRRNFDSAYLAWFPFARHYLFGKISDDINKYKNVKSSNSKILLILSIVFGASILIFCSFIFISIAELLGAASTLTTSSEYWIKIFSNKFNSFLVMITVVFIIYAIFNIFYCICANTILKDYIPKLSGLMCIIVILNLFLFKDKFIDSIISLAISTNEPESLKNSNQVEY